MAAGEPVRYRKLPGHRRGIINSSSLWLGPDHLLLVKSQRFKEEYKRFYLRDIQAVAIARYGRFHLSTRSLFLAFLWFVSLGMSQLYPRITGFVWTSAFVLVAAWLYISFDRSCICRLYTAVSSDPLPSVYRTWTARRFLAELEPRIREVQGELDPALLHADPPQPSPAGAALAPDAAPFQPEPPSASAVATGEPRTNASDLFLAAIFLEAGLDAAAFRFQIPGFVWIAAALTAAQIAAAVFVFIDRNRGRLSSPIHKVAIVKLVWLTLLYYANTIVNAANRVTQNPLAPANEILRIVDLCASIGLLAAGLTLSWRREPPPTSVLGN